MRSCQIEYVASDKDVGMVCGPQFNPPRLNSESRVASLSTDTEFRIISISAPPIRTRRSRREGGCFLPLSILPRQREEGCIRHEGILLPYLPS